MAIGIMEVFLVNAKGLSDTDLIGESTIPVWNEKFSFKVEYPGGNGQYKLVLKLMDKDTFSADDFLGQATIYLEDLFLLGVENGIAEIHPRKYSVVQADNTYRGEIQVGITFTPKVPKEMGREEFGGWKQSEY